MLRHAALLTLAIVAALAGCQPAGPARYQINGKVTCAGKPVPSGLIRFEPDASQGNSGPVGYAAIKDGRYTTDTKGCKGALEGPLSATGPGHHKAATPPDSERLCPDARKSATPEAESGHSAEQFLGPEDENTPLASRSSAGSSREGGLLMREWLNDLRSTT